MKVTIQHLHSVPTWNGRQGYCHSQARLFFQRHGLDWLAFVRGAGVDSDVLLATGDALAISLVGYVQEAGDGQQ